MAGNVVEKIEGVEKVDNQIKVLPVSGNDDQIRRATYRAIYGNSTLAPYSMRAVPPIHIIVDNGHVILKGVVDNKAFVKDSWGADIVEDLTPQDDDIVIEGKRGLDTFASTNLDFILRSTGVTKIALGGFLTNCCVESTMRSAYERGYDVITLTDCVAATSQEEHANALTYDYPMFSRPMTSTEFVEELKGAGGGSDASRGY